MGKQIIFMSYSRLRNITEAFLYKKLLKTEINFIINQKY